MKRRYKKLKKAPRRTRESGPILLPVGLNTGEEGQQYEEKKIRPDRPGVAIVWEHFFGWGAGVTMRKIRWRILGSIIDEFSESFDTVSRRELDLRSKTFLRIR